MITSRQKENSEQEDSNDDVNCDKAFNLCCTRSIQVELCRYRAANLQQLCMLCCRDNMSKHCRKMHHYRVSSEACAAQILAALEQGRRDLLLTHELLYWHMAFGL